MAQSKTPPPRLDEPSRGAVLLQELEFGISSERVGRTVDASSWDQLPAGHFG